MNKKQGYKPRTGTAPKIIPVPHSMHANNEFIQSSASPLLINEQSEMYSSSSVPYYENQQSEMYSSSSVPYNEEKFVSSEIQISETEV